VSAYRDAARTSLIEVQSYVISVVNGVIVEAGRGNDLIDVVNLAVPLILRGGDGDDVLRGSYGADTFEGDTGNDQFVGGAGSDTYLFRGPQYMDHGQDTINDASGSDDVLDFSALDFAVDISLAATTNQEVERRPTQIFWVNGQRIELPIIGPFSSRLDLDLTSGSASTGIENIRGTRFADRIRGNELDNDLFGNAGNDSIWGYDGLDMLAGGIGDDILWGGSARDQLFGDLGRDQLCGEAGNDRLDGGFDGLLDVLNGGEGADQFVQRYTWEWTKIPTPPYLRRSRRLVDGESLADFNASLGDVTVDVYV
jgi:Ca2+-binding RTX toxin-like protein